MDERKLDQIIDELTTMGLNDTVEYRALLKYKESGDFSKPPAGIESTLEKMKQYRLALKKVWKNNQEPVNSFRAILDSLETDGREVEPSKPFLEDKYKIYLKDKQKLKEDLKELRKKTIAETLQTPGLSEFDRKKLFLERKFIDAMPLYESLRHHTTRGLMEYVNNNADFLMEKHYFDRNFFRREKVYSNLEKIEKFELQIKSEQEKRKKLKQRAFLQELFVCNTDFAEFHKRKAKFLKKTANNAKMQLEALKKKDQKEIDNDERERLEAIKAQNFKVYGDLLKKAKNQRIMEILEETDNFLKEIGSKVIESKGENLDLSKFNTRNEDGEYDISKSTLLTENYNTIYYNFTHFNIEEIKEQPSLLEGGQLKNYQMQGLKWMVSLYNNKLSGILADEMGLGKTIQTISLFCYCMEHKQNFGPFLVVVPLSTLPNWKMEFEKWAPRIKKIIYKGNPQQRKEIAYYLRHNKFNVCLTTYEYVLKDKSELNRFHWQYIVVDEGHKMKNPKSKFAQTLGLQYNSEHRLLLTGTPLQNNLVELWSLMNFLLPKVFASSDDFEKWFKMPMKKLGQEKELDLNEEEKLLIVHRFHQVLRPFLLRRVKKEVEAELPQKVEYIIKVDLSSWQKVIYNQIRKRESAALVNSVGKLNNLMMNNMIMQLRKICNHPYLFLDYYNESEELMRSSGKFELLDRIVPKLIKTGHRMLIFTQMTQVIDLLEVFMSYRGIKYLRLDGTTKHEERAERMAMFNKENSEYPVFLLSTRAGGLGLNLQTADTVILFDSDWNPQMDLQAQDRVHRIGTLREVRVFRLVTNGTIEEEILSKASYKRSLDEMVIQAGLYNNRSTDLERRQRVEEIIKKQSLERDDDDEIPNDEEINKILSRDDEEFELFMELDKLRYEQEKSIYKDFNKSYNYRLLGPDEIPEFVRGTQAPAEEKEEATGKRKIRIKNLEELLDDDSIDEELAKIERDKRKRIKERTMTKNKKADENDNQSDVQEVMDLNEMQNDDDIFIDSDE